MSLSQLFRNVVNKPATPSTGAPSEPYSTDTANALLHQGGLIFDSSADYRGMTALANAVASSGDRARFFLLDFNHPERSNTYNPLLRCGGLTADALLQGIPVGAEGFSGSSAYYEQGAKHLVITAVEALRSAGRLCTFEDLLILFSSVRGLEGLLRMPLEDEPRLALECCLDKLRTRDKHGTYLSEDKLQLEVRAKLNVLGYLACVSFAPIFNTYTPDLTMRDVLTKQQIVYVMLPAGASPDLRTVLRRLVLADLSSVCAMTHNIVPAHALLPDAGTHDGVVVLNAPSNIRSGDWFQPISRYRLPSTSGKPGEPAEYPMDMRCRYREYLRGGHADGVWLAEAEGFKA